MPQPIGAGSSSVTIPPVHISGDAAPAPSPPRASSPPSVTAPPPSVQSLVKAHDSATAPRSCVAEGVTAAYGALEVVGAAGATVLGAALGPLGVAVGLASLSAVSYDEGQKLRALYNCAKE
ncbi:MAG: hypothetical protein K0R38_3370 [Polyangiaceae bacterium]|nr:hypothetical protein [Polyangiaceae bacterium]